MTTCKNCGNSFEGKYCPDCSQKADTHRLTFGHVAHEVFHAFTHTDKGILFLIKELLVRPGIVAKEYNSGKRKKYFNPFTFLLIVLAVQVFLTNQTGFFTHYAEVMGRFIAEQQHASTMDALSEQKMQQQIDLMQHNTKIMNFVFVPFMAFLSWIFFRRSGQNFVEHLVLNILVAGITIVFFIVLCIVPFLVNKTVGIVMLYLQMIPRVVYFTIAYKQYFQNSWGTTIFKAISIQIIFVLLLQIISLLMFRFYL